MFPLNSNMPYIKDNGERDKLGNVIGSGGGGGGGTVTPDYENEILDVGTVGDWHYYIPMSKEYVGAGNRGYEIKTLSNSGANASVEVYKFFVIDGEISYKEKVATVVYNAYNPYEDDNIKVDYNSKWIATLKTNMKEVSDDTPVTSPVEWAYSTNVDYNWYIPET